MTLAEATVTQQFEDLGYANRELIAAVSTGPGLPTNLGVPSAQALTRPGDALFTLMELNRLPAEDIEAAVELL